MQAYPFIFRFILIDIGAALPLIRVKGESLQNLHHGILISLPPSLHRAGLSHHIPHGLFEADEIPVRVAVVGAFPGRMACHRHFLLGKPCAAHAERPYVGHLYKSKLRVLRGKADPVVADEQAVAVHGAELILPPFRHGQGNRAEGAALGHRSPCGSGRFCHVFSIASLVFRFLRRFVRRFATALGGGGFISCAFPAASVFCAVHFFHAAAAFCAVLVRHAVLATALSRFFRRSLCTTAISCCSSFPLSAAANCRRYYRQASHQSQSSFLHASFVSFLCTSLILQTKYAYLHRRKNRGKVLLWPPDYSLPSTPALPPAACLPGQSPLRPLPSSC